MMKFVSNKITMDQPNQLSTLSGWFLSLKIKILEEKLNLLLIRMVTLHKENESTRFKIDSQINCKFSKLKYIFAQFWEGVMN